MFYSVLFIISSLIGQQLVVSSDDSFTENSTEWPSMVTNASTLESDSLLAVNESSVYPLYLDDDNETETSTQASDAPNLSASESSTDELYAIGDEEHDNNTDDQSPDDKPYSFSATDDKHTSNRSSFSCYGRQFGQYADAERDCHVFHLCYPYVNDDSSELEYQRITFLCHNESVFDQKSLLCVDNSTLGHPCEDSPLYYSASNENYLGRVMNFISDLNGLDGEQSDGHSTTPRPMSSLWSYWFRN